MKVTNLSRNTGNKLMKAIYKKAYELDATEVVINKVSYEKYAVVNMFEGNDAICWDYTIAI